MVSSFGFSGFRLPPRRGRHLRIRPWLVIAPLAAALCVTAAAAAGRGASAAKPVLRYGAIEDIANLDPAKGITQTPLWFAYAPILQVQPNGSVAPGLAASWRYFDTGTGPQKGFEFTLRHNARFSDGTPVTAAAVVKWLEYFAAANGSYATYLGPNPSFQSVGKWTVRIRVRISNPSIPYILAVYGWGFVASPRALANPALFTSASYGAGPYRLDATQSVIGDHYTYLPNPYYYDKPAIKYSQVYVKVIADPASRLQALRAGQLDVARGDASTADAAAAAGFNVVLPASPSVTMRLVLTARDEKPLSDVGVRQALNFAIDRKAITAAVLGKYGAPTSEIVSVDGFDPKLRSFYPYNAQKAKSLLAAAGYPNGFTLKVLGLPDAGSQAALQAVAKYLSAIDVKLDITSTVTIAEYVSKIQDRSFNIVQHTTGTLPMTRFYGINLSPTGNLNPRHVDDPVMDKLYYTGIKSSNALKYFKQISERMTKQAYFIPIAGALTPYYASKKTGGVVVGSATVGEVIPVGWYPK